MVAVEVNSMVLPWKRQITLVCLFELHAEDLASLGAGCADVACFALFFDVHFHLGPEISAHKVFCDSVAAEMEKGLMFLHYECFLLFLRYYDKLSTGFVGYQ